MHDIDKIIIDITHRLMDLLMIHIHITCIIPATSYGSKLCFIINLYFYITFVYDFDAILYQ